MRKRNNPNQGQLFSPQIGDWKLSLHTREIGKRGVAMIRETLRKTKPKE